MTLEEAAAKSKLEMSRGKIKLLADYWEARGKLTIKQELLGLLKEEAARVVNKSDKEAGIGGVRGREEQGW